MKNRLLFFTLAATLTMYIVNTNAQSNVGIGTTNPNPKALLELQSTDKGFLIPRVTTTERTAIAPSGLGDRALLVYDTDDNLFYFWDGTQWVGFPQQNSGSNNISLNFDVNTGTLSLTDAGGTLTTNIPPDNDSDPANELITNVVFGTGNILTIDEGGNTWSTTINVNDADSDPTNEFNTNFTFNNTTNTLAITDAGSTLNVDLSSLNDTYSAGTGINISGNVISNTGDLSNTNELITNISLNAATGVLTITEGGNNNTVNLSSFGNDWKLTGNTGTNPATNFLGTTDNQALVFRTNNAERARISADGNFGIGVTNPTQRLQVNGNVLLVNGTAQTWLPFTDGFNYISGDRTILRSADLATNIGFFCSTCTDALTINSGRLRVNNSFMMQDGTQAAGRVMRSNANGVGSWQDITSNTTWNSGSGKVQIGDLLIQWGRVGSMCRGSDRTRTVTFPDAFTSVMTVVATARGNVSANDSNQDNAWVQVETGSESNTGFTLRWNAHDAGDGCIDGANWLAIGQR